MTALQGKVALVTGAAKNIGRAIFKSLARAGASVMGVARSAELGAALAQEVRGEGGRADFCCCDLTEPEQIRLAVQRTVATFGGLDIIVNNAAATHIIRSGDEHSVVDEPLATFDRFMQVGVYGPFLLAKFGVPEMIKRGGGVIISISSIAAVKASLGMCAYGPSKAALESLTNQIAVDYGPLGIRAVAVRVGMIRTDENCRLHDHPTVGPLMRATQMLQRSGLPEDVAEAVTFLASERGSFITAGALAVDAGHAIKQTMPDVMAVFAGPRTQ